MIGANKHARRSKVRLLIADENRMNCQLLITALERSRGIHVVGFANTAPEVLSESATSSPNVALISARLQDGSLTGFDAVRELHSRFPKIRAILLLDSEDRAWIIDAFRVGAKGVFCREGSLSALLKCVQTVHLGQIWVNSEQLESVLEAFARISPARFFGSHDKTPLSRREQQVAEFVAEGLTNREIAARLRLSEHTVKNYMFHIFEKMGMSSRVELVLYAHDQHRAQDQRVAPAPLMLSVNEQGSPELE